MTPSTTNTAARELLELIDRYWDLAYAEGKEGRTHDTEAGDAQQCRHEIESRIATLPQQQGGEQEARELLALECGFDPDSCGKFEGAVVSEAGALRAIAAALQAGTP